MIAALSANTQAILLLTAPLIAGPGAAAPELLTPSEYRSLARHLRELGREPADLLLPGADTLIGDCQAIAPETRLKRLLGRGFLLSQVLERWQARAIWVISRADAGYPRRLKARLKEEAPAVLYGCGDGGLLDTGGLAVVGSRAADEVLIDYAAAIGDLAARADRTLVSGGARGIDQAAMRGALNAGGAVVGLLADSLERAAMARDHRAGLLDRRLVLASPYDPNAGFNVGNAMQRNKLIYALADAALVVNADSGKGGTWAGAVEQIDKRRPAPVYVRSTGMASPGLAALLARGALSWPDPVDPAALAAVIDDAGASPVIAETMPLFGHGASSASGPAPLPAPATGRNPGPEHPAQAHGTADATPPAPAGNGDPAAALLAAVRTIILPLLATPMTEGAVAEALGVSTPQARVWLKDLVERGDLGRCRKPAGYVARDSGLFSV